MLFHIRLRGSNELILPLQSIKLLIHSLKVSTPYYSLGQGGAMTFLFGTHFSAIESSSPIGALSILYANLLKAVLHIACCWHLNTCNPAVSSTVLLYSFSFFPCAWHACNSHYASTMAVLWSRLEISINQCHTTVVYLTFNCSWLD